MTLLSICNAALLELSGFSVPSTFYGNNDLTAKLCVALANREGKTLEKELRWQELVTEHTFTTTSGTASYALPTDFRAFANMSQWDRSNQFMMTGPTPPAVWQWLQSGLVVASENSRWFAVRGNRFLVYPTPTVDDDELVFDYYSKNWVTKQADSTNTSEWSADNDTSRLDEDLMTLGLKWRFLQAKGMPYEPEYKEYESIKEALRDDNAGRSMISLNRRPPSFMDGRLPDGGFGGSSDDVFIVDD